MTLRLPFGLQPPATLVAKVLGGLSLGLALALAFTVVWGRAGWRTAESYQLAHRLQKEAYQSAQAAARNKALAQRIRTENRYAELSRQADYAENQVADLRAAADRFGRLRAQAARGAPGRSLATAPGYPAQDRDRPGENALAEPGVLLTKPEYDELVANTLRLERVRRWGETLIQDGLALPEVEFGASAFSPSP